MLGRPRPVGLDDPLPQASRPRLSAAGADGQRRRARRRPGSAPVPRSSRSHRAAVASARCTEHHRLPRGQAVRPTVAIDPLGSPASAGQRVVGQDHVDHDRDRRSGAPSRGTMSDPGVGGGRPVHRPRGCRPAGRAGRPVGSPARRAPAPARRRRRRARVAPGGRSARPSAGRRAAAGAAGPRSRWPTTGGRTGALEASSTTTASTTPAPVGCRTTSTVAGRAGRSAGPVPGADDGAAAMRSGPSATDGHAPPAVRPRRRRGSATQVTAARRPGTAGATSPITQHAGQQGAQRLDPTRAAGVGHAGPATMATTATRPPVPPGRPPGAVRRRRAEERRTASMPAASAPDGRAARGPAGLHGGDQPAGLTGRDGRLGHDRGRPGPARRRRCLRRPAGGPGWPRPRPGCRRG